jgi:hypothetical protein
MSTGQWINGKLTVNAITTLTSPLISGRTGSLNLQTGPILLDFNEFWVQRGITFNGTTKRFTVPIDGIYRITMNPEFHTSGGGARILVGVNTDTPTTNTHFGHCYRQADTYDSGCINSVVQLNGGDYIAFYLQVGILLNTTGSRYNQFTIRYIGGV